MSLVEEFKTPLVIGWDEDEVSGEIRIVVMSDIVREEVDEESPSHSE